MTSMDKQLVLIYHNLTENVKLHVHLLVIYGTFGILGQ